ncbi:CASP-like protein 2 [Gastrolobium bilobum]|uniref:CASP-like protein 2 n=1 Tax=Gastrolobium bilobum TaxID=150636 RepID=UPI002AB2D456|nr:CASP-like protein 2 [Gastrolobium bilobum]
MRPFKRFFVTSNSIVCGYLVLLLALSFFHIVRTSAVKSRILLCNNSTKDLFIYVAHCDNPNANWFPFCGQYNNFYERISGSLIGSFIAVVLFMILILMSSISISRH